MLYRLSYMSLNLPILERVAGIEPAYSAWKADVLPLNYTRLVHTQLNMRSNYTHPRNYLGKVVVGEGFEPSKLSRQIYSLIPLATREPHQKGRVFSSPAQGLSGEPAKPA